MRWVAGFLFALYAIYCFLAFLSGSNPWGG